MILVIIENIWKNFILIKDKKDTFFMLSKNKFGLLGMESPSRRKHLLNGKMVSVCYISITKEPLQ